MAKHLTSADITIIKKILHVWKGKLTWEALCIEVAPSIGKKPTRQSLNMHEDIVEAYLMKKKTIQTSRIVLKKPASLKIAAQRIRNIENSMAILERQNNLYKEQFTLWQYNAYKCGMKLHQLNAPLPEKKKGCKLKQTA
ncbi:hypothetical protein CUU54_06855 [Pectobacterium polaris]|uniref:hypothetical protein n=1 Tax=Pectobacterium polaris TaxID=2042057 RepID=UPI000D61EFEA|nr:hypothetical protein [Pectobacterium polaris]MCU1788578.1 hypothetical protein [Pectobacterium polaris]PWD57964.1 hypothetical protein DF209_13830 [Pectobacterium polaris]